MLVVHEYISIEEGKRSSQPLTRSPRRFLRDLVEPPQRCSCYVVLCRLTITTQGFGRDWAVRQLSKWTLTQVLPLSPLGICYKTGVATSRRFSMPKVREQLWKDPLYSNTSPAEEVIPGSYQKLATGKGLAGLFKAQGPELLIDYTSLLQAPTVAPTPSVSTPLKEERADRSLEDRLRTLKKLREQGLITEEEYSEKKKRLLDRL